MKVAYIGREITKGGANLLPILHSLPESVEWKMFCSKSDLGAALIPYIYRKELKNYDVLHINTSLYGALAGGVGKPIVSSVHTIQKTEYELDSTIRNQIGVIFEHYTIKKATKFVVVSPHIANDLLRHYPNVDKNKIEILPHVAVDSDPFITFKEKPLHTEIVLASGRLVKRKNFGLLIECAKRCPNISFVLVGEGPELKKLETKSKRLHNFSINAYLPRKDYVNLLSNSLVYILTSKYEGYPTVVFEAMVAGTPVLANPIPALGDMIIDEKTGAYFSSPREFAEKLAMLIDNRELYFSIQRDARNYVETMPTTKEIALKFVQIYEELT